MLQKLISAAAILTLSLVSVAAYAQPGGGTGIGGHPLVPGLPTYSLATDQVVSGTITEITILVDSEGPTVDGFGLIETNATELQILSLGIGSGLQQFIDDGGIVPTCDLVIEGSGGSAFFSMIHPDFDTAVYGNEYLTITLVANATPGTESTVTIVGMGGETVTTMSIVAPGAELMRGDVNVDGNCDVTDAVELLGALFVPGESADCEDAADIDDNGTLEITDAILLLNSLFAGGAPLDDTCQIDSSADDLAPCTTTACSP